MRWSRWGSMVVGLVLVGLMTLPTATRLTSVGRLDTNDGRFSIWNIAWVAHALLDTDASVLDANIFAPHRGTLAYSELNLVGGLFALPWYAATGDPLAALNGAVLVALWLAFVLMHALVRRLTASDGAGLVAATAFTFCPYVSARTAHIQLLMIFVFPLVMLAFHALAERATLWRGILLGGALAVAALACGYYGLFVGCVLGVAVVFNIRRSQAYWVALAIAAVAAAVIVYPVFHQFVDARVASGAEVRPWQPDEARPYSANISAWLASAAFGHEWWLRALAARQKWTDVLFPGLTLLALSAGGLWFGLRTAGHRATAALYAVVAVLATWASFGPAGGLYTVLHETIPGMSMLRAPARLGIVTVFALAVLSGLTVASLRRRWRWLPVALTVLLVAELGVRTPEWGWPSWPLRERLPLASTYQRLATLPRGVLLEFPFPYVRSDYHNHARAMFWSTYHWQRLVNGYSDLIPPDFDQIAVPINEFPSADAFRLARDRDVRYVLWNIAHYTPEGRDVIRKRLEGFAPYLRPIVVTDDAWLYEVVAWPS